jgi:hypothetical protein
MRKADAEKAIRHLCNEWGDVIGFPRPAIDAPSFLDFKQWCGDKGFEHYFEFRSVMGARYDAERWFDEEFGQTWRN